MEREQKSPYLLGLVPDFLLMGGGLSILLYLAFRGLIAAQLLKDDRAAILFAGVPVWKLGMWLSFVVNYPHFAATFYRLYRSAESRAYYPLTTWLSPLVVLAALLAALGDPEGFGSILVKVFLL